MKGESFKCDLDMTKAKPQPTQCTNGSGCGMSIIDARAVAHVRSNLAATPRRLNNDPMRQPDDPQHVQGN